MVVYSCMLGQEEEVANMEKFCPINNTSRAAPAHDRKELMQAATYYTLAGSSLASNYPNAEDRGANNESKKTRLFWGAEARTLSLSQEQYASRSRSLPLGGKSETPHGVAQTEVPEITFDNVVEEAQPVAAGDLIPACVVVVVLLRFSLLLSILSSFI
jgi:hypothetical protein